MIEYSVESEGGGGSAGLLLHLEAVHEKVRLRIKEALDDAADAAVDYAVTHVPRGDNPRQALHLWETIRKSEPVVYRPGGRGGGGFYEAHVSAGGHDPNSWPNPHWLIEGTGLFGPRHSRIRAKSFKRMGPGWWHSSGGWFWNSTAGQRPQPGWWIGAYETANLVLSEKARTIDARI